MDPIGFATYKRFDLSPSAKPRGAPVWSPRAKLFTVDKQQRSKQRKLMLFLEITSHDGPLNRGVPSPARLEKIALVAERFQL
jgi:hypothetical protein